MIEVETTPRKWGNSIGISLSKEVVEQANIKPDKSIRLFIPDKKINLAKVFGTLKIKESAQAILDKIREGKE